MLSTRLRQIADTLPLRRGMRVLEIGCGPGALARAIAARLGDGYVLGIDRSEAAISKAGALVAGAGARLEFQCIAIEDFRLRDNAPPFDLAIAIRVGAFDGRQPRVADEARLRVFTALTPGGRFFIDGGDPLKEVARP